MLVCRLTRYRYDFDLRTGQSETGLKACTYAVQLQPSDTDGDDDIVWVEVPEGGTNWRLVELRPVSEGSLLSPFCPNFALSTLMRTRVC